MIATLIFVPSSPANQGRPSNPAASADVQVLEPQSLEPMGVQEISGVDQEGTRHELPNPCEIERLILGPRRDHDQDIRALDGRVDVLEEAEVRMSGNLSRGRPLDRERLPAFLP